MLITLICGHASVAIMDLSEFRDYLAHTSSKVQWTGYCSGKYMVRMGTSSGYNITILNPTRELKPNYTWDVVPNRDVNQGDPTTISVVPPDTSVFAEIRALSVLGINIGNDCMPGTGKEYIHEEQCVCSYDIETDMSDVIGGGMALVGCPIISVAAHCSCGKEFFMPTTPGLTTSADVCAGFIEFVMDHRPVWLIGYNCYAYDNMHIQFYLREKSWSNFLSIRAGISGVGNDATLINIPGVYNVDVYQYLMRTRRSKFKSMKLEHVAENLGCTKKLPMPSMTTRVPYDVLKEYNMNDCVVAAEVWRKSNIYLEIPSLAIVSCSHIYDSCRYITGIMMACGFASEALLRKKLVIWGQPSDPQEYGGGLVLDPQCGVHDDVEIYDFKSMYPSVMVSCNISPETLISKRPKTHEDVGLPIYSKHNGISTIVLENTVVQFDGNITSIPCSIMSTMISLRRKVRKSNPAYAAALKIGANSFYGALGYANSPLYSPSCSSSITTVSRHCLRTAVDVSNSLGKRVVYGDTDSVFVTNVTKSGSLNAHEDDTKEFTTELARRLDEMDIYGVEMEREAVFTRLLLLGKKRYCAVQRDGQVKLTGISAVRQDSFGLVRECSKGMAHAILYAEGDSYRHALVMYITRALDLLCQNDLSLYEASKQVRKHGIKGFYYTTSDGSEVVVPVNEVELGAMVDCDKSIISASLGSEMRRFTEACKMGSPSEAIRDYAPLW